MKRFMKYKTLAFLVLLVAAFSSCEEGDGSADYGYAKIYMPQAIISGGLTSNYPVPSGGGTMTYNFKVNAENNLDVILGVLRAGKLETSDAYTVDVVVNSAMTTTALASDPNAIAMPSSMYSFPASVSVSGGKAGESFYLTVKAEALKSSAYTGKKLILTLGLANPSKYTLADTNTNTVIIIDVDAIRAFL